MTGARVERGEALEAWGTVGDLLATGHFAAFYRVSEASRPLVAEVLVDDFARTPAVAEAFLAEARRWSAVSHASLATPIGLGRTASGVPFSVGEAIDGIPLAAYIAQGQRFPADLVAALLHQLLDALAPLHRLGMSHGAIATTRLTLVRRASGSFSARLRGFGRRAIASVASRDAFDGLTRLDAISFASPDVARGAPADDDADRWALAVLAHELLTGRAPLGGPTPFARYQALVRQTTAPTIALPPDSAALHEFFAVAFAPQRAQRFATTEAMIEALLRAVTPRSGAPVGDQVPSVEAPMVTAPSAPILETAIVSSARPVSMEAPSHWAREAPGEVPRDRPSNRRAGFESTLSSEAPREILEAIRSVPPPPPAAAKLGGTMRSAIDPSELDAEVSRRLAQGAFWRDPRVVAAFALGMMCGLLLGVLLMRTGHG